MACSLIQQEESQRDVLVGPTTEVEASAMYSKGDKNDMICKSCGNKLKVIPLRDAGPL